MRYKVPDILSIKGEHHDSVTDPLLQTGHQHHQRKQFSDSLRPFPDVPSLGSLHLGPFLRSEMDLSKLDGADPLIHQAKSTPQMITDAPRFVNWNYTHICNFNCAFCYSRDPEDGREMDTVEINATCDRIVDARVFQVNFGGGEPLVRNDVEDAIAHLARHGVRTLLSSNGWLLDESRLAHLHRIGLRAIYVSLDHVSADQHDLSRKTPGSFDRVVQAIRTGSRLGLEMLVSTVVTRNNVGALEQLAIFAAETGAAGVNFKRYRPVGRARQMEAALTLTQEQAADTMKLIRRLKRDGIIDIYFLYNESPIPGVDEGCPCAFQSLAIRPNGDIGPCVYSPVTIGNILKHNLTDLWRRSPVLQGMRQGRSCSAMHA